MKIHTFVKKSTLGEMNYVLEVGWGNGYAIIPKGHPLHGKGSNELDKIIDVHCGITFGQYVSDLKDFIPENVLKNLSQDDFVIGFDTCHWMDNQTNWNEQNVINETIRMANQIEKRC